MENIILIISILCSLILGFISGFFCGAGWKSSEDYIDAIDDMTDNLIRNSQTEVINDDICNIVTDKRIKIIANEMKKSIMNTEVNTDV